MLDNPHAAVTSAEAPAGSATVDADFFIVKDGVRYAGGHLLVDLWGAKGLTDPTGVEAALCAAARACNATILHAHIHQFGEGGGVSGVVMLAESHISIHTWPEKDFAAVDVFMCGACDPYRSLPVLKEAFRADTVQLSEHRRGLVP